VKGRKPELRPIEGGLSGVPRPPEHLSPAAAEEWNRVAPDLVKRRILNETALTTLAHYCMASAMAREADRSIAKHGLLIDTPAGPKSNPAVRMQTQYLEIARRYAIELGITPSSRSRKGLSGQEGKRETNDASDLGI
jgi:P27 family predicted phage terminase small subunit